MEKETIDYSSMELGPKLEQLEPKVRQKALALAKGIMSVYGLAEAHAIEEGIIRAKKFYKEKRGLEIRTRTIGGAN